MVANDNHNYQHACHLISTLVSLGVKQIVISPGSRSTPITLAAEHHPELNCYYILDERSAGFFALGLSSSTQNNSSAPIAILATSGSAIANWFPAVVEASYSFTPLLLLSADRPAQLQYAGANQTIDQINIFGSYVKKFIQLEEMSEIYPCASLSRKITQAVSACQWPVPGPVHINIPIAEPLIANIEQIERIENDIFPKIPPSEENDLSKNKSLLTFPKLQLYDSDIKQIIGTINLKKGIIICGRENYSSHSISLINTISQNLNCPVLADPLSNLRFKNIDNLIVNYDAFLRSELADDIYKADWILRFGQFPISKSLEIFLSKLKLCHFLLCDPYGLWPDPLNHTHTMLRCDAEQFCLQMIKQHIEYKNNKWIQRFNQLDQKTQLIINDFIKKQDNHEGLIIDCLLKQLKGNSLLFSANSMTIRDLDTFITHSKNKALTIKANRGASGIDGNISTFLGMLASKNNYNQAIALLGDLTFLHDLSSLILLKQLKFTNPIIFIVINNRGGGIFNYLPQKQLDCFEKAWICEQDMDFSTIAQLYHLHFTCINQLSDFDEALEQALTIKSIHLIEVVIDQNTSVEKHHILFDEIKRRIK